MKKQLFILAIVFLGNFAFAQSADETAIKKIINSQDLAFDAVDYKSYMGYWAKVSYASFLYHGGNYVGDALWKKIEEYWVGRKPRTVSATRTDWNFRIKDETAFVTFNQKNESIVTKSVSESFQARFLEKMNGEWKIVSVSVIEKPSK